MVDAECRLLPEHQSPLEQQRDQSTEKVDTSELTRDMWLVFSNWENSNISCVDESYLPFRAQ
jgi:hypothetical protein